MIKTIVFDEIVYAIIIESQFRGDGLLFFTPADFPQQLGYMNRPQGYKVAPHKHNLVERTLIKTQEVLLVKSGKIKIDIYDIDDNFLESALLNKGDLILLADGGHGIEWLENGELIEVKQGPYLQEKDKVMIEVNTQNI